MAIIQRYIQTIWQQKPIAIPSSTGSEIARKICNTEPVKHLITSEFSPGDAVGDDYDGLLEWARNSATTIYHPTGTCEMGTDKMAVVDPALKVYGIKGLR